MTLASGKVSTSFGSIGKGKEGDGRRFASFFSLPSRAERWEKDVALARRSALTSAFFRQLSCSIIDARNASSPSLSTLLGLIDE